jgi:GT2 family glycosyltransferase
VKEMATGDILILMDGDLLVTPGWVSEVLSCNILSTGWGKLSDISEEGTLKYLKTKYIDSSLVKSVRAPAMGGAAGGITVVPAKLFKYVGGIPEDFLGSWGGEDNAFWAKMKALGNEVNRFSSEVYHLYHSPSTPRVRTIQDKIKPMMSWNGSQWKSYIDYVGDSWGLPNPSQYREPSSEYIASKSNARVTLAMLSWLRYNKLIFTLEKLINTLTIPTNLILRVQGAEKLNDAQKVQIRSLAEKFNSNIVYYTQGNIGTCRARVDLIGRALKWFHTPYINIADDDTYYTKGSVEAAIDYMDNNLDVGVAGIRYKPEVYVLDSNIHPRTLFSRKAKKDIEEVASTGTATAFIRREVFDLCSIDPFYVIGYWDLDIFLQARSVGWKVTNIKLFEDMKGINDWEGNAEYRAWRVNRQEIWRSRRYFRQKFGLERTV